MTFRGNAFSPDAAQSFGAARRDMPTAESDNTEALRAGAESLLEKALDAIAEDDEERANRYINRSCSLPYDEREEYHPGPEMANFLTYSFLAELAEIIGTDDVWWVDLTLAYAQTLDDMGHAALTDNLYVLTHEAEYQLPAAAMARVRQSAGQHTSGGGTGRSVRALTLVSPPIPQRLCASPARSPWLPSPVVSRPAWPGCPSLNSLISAPGRRRSRVQRVTMTPTSRQKVTVWKNAPDHCSAPVAASVTGQ